MRQLRHKLTSKKHQWDYHIWNLNFNENLIIGLHQTNLYLDFLKVEIKCIEPAQNMIANSLANNNKSNGNYNKFKATKSQESLKRNVYFASWVPTANLIRNYVSAYHSVPDICESSLKCTKF